MYLAGSYLLHLALTSVTAVKYTKTHVVSLKDHLIGNIRHCWNGTKLKEDANGSIYGHKSHLSERYWSPGEISLTLR